MASHAKNECDGTDARLLETKTGRKAFHQSTSGHNSVFFARRVARAAALAALGWGEQASAFNIVKTLKEEAKKAKLKIKAVPDAASDSSHPSKAASPTDTVADVISKDAGVEVSSITVYKGLGGQQLLKVATSEIDKVSDLHSRVEAALKENLKCESCAFYLRIVPSFSLLHGHTILENSDAKFPVTDEVVTAVHAVISSYQLVAFDSEEKLAKLVSSGKNDESLQFESNDMNTQVSLVGRYGMTLQFASDDLKGEKEVVLAAVKQNGLALQFASDTLKNDEEVVLAAVNQNWAAIDHASEHLRQEGDKALEALKKDGLKLFEHPIWKKSNNVVLAAVSQNGMALQHASYDEQHNRQVVLKAVEQNGMALQFASEELKADSDVVKAATTQNWRASWYAEGKLSIAQDQSGMAFGYGLPLMWCVLYPATPLILALGPPGWIVYVGVAMLGSTACQVATHVALIRQDDIREGFKTYMARSGI